MKTHAFAVTFETFTPESVEIGDADERGFVEERATLRDCIPAIAYGFSCPSHCARPEPNATQGRVRWLTFAGYRSTRDGDNHDESRALHIPESVTAASTRRIARLFGARVTP